MSVDHIKCEWRHDHLGGRRWSSPLDLGKQTGNNKTWAVRFCKLRISYYKTIAPWLKSQQFALFLTTIFLRSFSLFPQRIRIPGNRVISGADDLLISVSPVLLPTMISADHLIGSDHHHHLLIRYFFPQLISPDRLQPSVSLSDSVVGSVGLCGVGVPNSLEVRWGPCIGWVAPIWKLRSTTGGSSTRATLMPIQVQKFKSLKVQSPNKRHFAT